MPGVPGLEQSMGTKALEPFPRANSAALLLAAVGALGGCTTVSIETPDGFGGDRTYLGIVTLRAPYDTAQVANLPRVRQYDVTTVGLRLKDGLGLGYLRDRWLVVPLDCRLVVIVRSGDELRHAARMLQLNSGESPCLAETFD